MNNHLFQSKRFVFGILFFAGLLIISFLVSTYPKTFFDVLPPYMKDKTGQIIATTPYSPVYVFPFGSDRAGTSMLFKVLDGAKFTMAIVGGVTILQIGIGLVFGSILAYMKEELTKSIQKLIQFYYFIPKLMWAILLWEFASGVLEEYILMAIILVPPLILVIAKEIKMILQKEFIQSSHVLGASKFYIFRKHIWVNIRQMLILQFIQQAVQTLTLLIHLGFFHIAIGGTTLITDFLTESSRYEGNINEWASMLGIYRVEAFTCPWMTLTPMIMIAISILVLNIMAQGLKSKTESKEYSILQ